MMNLEGYGGQNDVVRRADDGVRLNLGCRYKTTDAAGNPQQATPTTWHGVGTRVAFKTPRDVAKSP